MQSLLGQLIVDRMIPPTIARRAQRGHWITQLSLYTRAPFRPASTHDTPTHSPQRSGATGYPEGACRSSSPDRRRGSTSVRSATGAELAGSWHLLPLRVRPLPPGLVCSPAAGHPTPQMVAGGHPLTGLPHRGAL